MNSHPCFPGVVTEQNAGKGSDMQGIRLVKLMVGFDTKLSETIHSNGCILVRQSHVILRVIEIQFPIEFFLHAILNYNLGSMQLSF